MSSYLIPFSYGPETLAALVKLYAIVPCDGTVLRA